MPEEYDLQVALLARELWQEGKRVLRWSNRPTSREHPWAEGWADVYVPEFCQALESNWLLTVADPEDEVGDEGCVQAEKDAYLLFEFELPESLAATKITYFSPFLDPQEIPVPQTKSESSHFYWSTYRQDYFRVLEASFPTYRVPVWSAERIGEITADWLEELSGHRFELLLDESIESPLDAQIKESIENMKSGKAETFDLGDGVMVSGEAFDFFLSNPEAAAEITAEIKKLLAKDEES